MSADLKSQLGKVAQEKCTKEEEKLEANLPQIKKTLLKLPN
ncbi:MAG: hypothetical protein NWF00_05990 [Candidatus Bathyarchaeota archaeon]|nr:hypothetical protein [Candidatus Bathyarchaeota archaeon]